MNRKILLYLLMSFAIVLSVHLANAAISYKPSEATVSGGSYNLNSINNTNYLEINGDNCFLKKSVRITSTGTLKFTQTSCKTVHMYPGVTVSVYGKVYFDGVKVTSYNPNTGQPMVLSRTNYKLQRPDIVTRSGAQYFSAKNSEFSHLGYYNSSSSHWGVALRFLPKAYITNSKFHDNYFGFYTFDSDYVTIKHSEVYDNLEYGIDIHDFSDYFYAYNNTVYSNGNHGLILSKYNKNSRISRNKVFDHTQNAFVKGVVKTYGTHGIELHEESNNAQVLNNELKNNRVGIKIFDSHNNTVKSNVIISDLEEGFYIDRSDNNFFQYNRVYDSVDPSLYSFNSFYNGFSSNKWYDTSNIIYVKIDDGSTIRRYKFPADSGADSKLNALQDPNNLPSTTSSSTLTTNNQRQILSLATTSEAPNEDVEESNNEDIDLDLERDKKLGKLAQTEERETEKEEKDFVKAVKKYEKELAEELELNDKEGENERGDSN